MSKSKAKKVTKKELESIKEAQSGLSGLLNEIGKLEYTKILRTKELEENSSKMETIKLDLEKKYGAVNIDLETGTISPLVTNEEN
jgi:hypothetical protein